MNKKLIAGLVVVVLVIIAIAMAINSFSSSKSGDAPASQPKVQDQAKTAVTGFYSRPCAETLTPGEYAYELEPAPTAGPKQSRKICFVKEEATADILPDDPDSPWDFKIDTNRGTFRLSSDPTVDQSWKIGTTGRIEWVRLLAIGKAQTVRIVVYPR